MENSKQLLADNPDLSYTDANAAPVPGELHNTAPGYKVLPAGEGLELLAALNAWREYTLPLMKRMPTFRDNLMHAGAGVAGEAGELVDAIKKHWAYNKPLDTTNIMEEAGDLLFYLFALLDMCDLSLEEVIDANTVKLRRRYPAGYSDKAAQARADKQ